MQAVSNLYLVGLTGGVACGKSTVAQMLAQSGVYVIDADDASRRVVQIGTRAYNAIVQEFGEDVLLNDGEINRVELRRRIFTSADSLALRRRLERLTHPEIRRLMALEVAKAAVKGYNFAVLDVPLLYETRMEKFFHR